MCVCVLQRTLGWPNRSAVTAARWCPLWGLFCIHGELMSWMLAETLLAGKTLVLEFIYTYTCWAPYLEVSSLYFTMAAIALFCASEQTHCAVVVLDSEWVIVALHGIFSISTKVVAVLFSCYMAGSTWNCWHLDTSSVGTIQPCTSLQCHYSKPHT